MRQCGPGEHGGVISKYSPFSEYEDYDWAIMPFEEYMHGFEAPDRAPLFGTPKLQRAIEEYSFGPLFSRALKTAGNGELPDGQWKAALATRFDRSLYIFSVETSAADDAAIVAAFNEAPNKSRFNFFYRNCSDQAKGIFDLVWPDDKIGSRKSGLTMQTPKGLAKALVDRAEAQPELRLRVRRYAQLPGTYPRSRTVLFPLENMYKSIAFAPWWFFGGFRVVALGAMFYHQVVAPFSVLQSSRDFISPRAAQLTAEQEFLRRRQDEIRLALAADRSHDARWSTLSVLNESVFRRLEGIRSEKQGEVDRVEGSKQHWQELDREFESAVREVDWRRFAPEEVAQMLTRRAVHGDASHQLFRYFDAHGEFFVEPGGRGPWMRLRLANGQMSASSLSMSQIGAGDPRVTALVLAAVLDSTLHESPARRESIDTVDGLSAAFRQATRVLSGLDNAADAR